MKSYQKWKWKNATHRNLIDMTFIFDKYVAGYLCTHSSQKIISLWTVFNFQSNFFWTWVTVFIFTSLGLVFLSVSSIVRNTGYFLASIQMLYCEIKLEFFIKYFTVRISNNCGLLQASTKMRKWPQHVVCFISSSLHCLFQDRRVWVTCRVHYKSFSTDAPSFHAYGIYLIYWVWTDDTKKPPPMSRKN